MLHRTLLNLLLLCMATCSGLARAYDFGAGEIPVPAGFNQQETRNVRNLGIIHEFQKPHKDSGRATSLQVTVYDFGQKLRRVPDGLLLAAAEDHLLDYLAGMRRHHDDFVYRKMPSRKINGIPTAHVEWSGVHKGEKMHGTIYSLVKASYVVLMHARDYEGETYDNLLAAIGAMEQLRFKPE